MPGGWTEEFAAVAGANIQYYKGGSGPPLVALHGLAGNPGWLIHHEKLAERYTVYAPSHPGYEKSQRPEWVESVQDLALFYTGSSKRWAWREQTAWVCPSEDGSPQKWQ